MCSCHGHGGDPTPCYTEADVHAFCRAGKMFFREQQFHLRDCLSVWHVYCLAGQPEPVVPGGCFECVFLRDLVGHLVRTQSTVVNSYPGRLVPESTRVVG